MALSSAKIIVRRFDGRMAFVPEGRCDRSLARSAWESATQKSRPVGCGVIRVGVRTDSMIGVMEILIAKTEKFCVVPFLDYNTNVRSYQALRDGFWRDVFLALRARLRSVSSLGTRWQTFRNPRRSVIGI